jgi:TM2 domain-containing membrane protein YozV
VAALPNLPHRSPWLAGALAIVPGAGHVYLGQPLIGLAALLWNGLFGFALYDAIHHQMVGLSLVLGVFESLWYFGNIFGAVSGAHKFNRDVELNALEQLRAAHDDRPEAWPPSR